MRPARGQLWRLLTRQAGYPKGRVMSSLRLFLRALPAVALLVPQVVLSPTAGASGPTTIRVNVRSTGGQANNDGTSNVPSISADGRFVAFDSTATNLVRADRNGFDDVFVHFRSSGKTTRVSVASDGAESNQNSGTSLSADGRCVAFSSIATNLVRRDTNRSDDIFIHTLSTGKTTRVSVASDGTQANAASFSPSLSANGRFISFVSRATNLVPHDTNRVQDIFVRDRSTGTTSRVSVASDGTQAKAPSFVPSISADGRFVAFSSRATTLVRGDTNGSFDIFVHDRSTGKTTRVSVATDGTQANDDSVFSSISADGRFVAFSSHAKNLIPSDTNGSEDIFVNDRLTGKTIRVSVASDGMQGNDGSGAPSISANGQFVAFNSDASNLVPGDTNSTGDVFVYRSTGTTIRVSVATDATQANGESRFPSISADGRFVAFISNASNLVQQDTNGSQDVFECGPLF